jgi:hypothetical protein
LFIRKKKVGVIFVTIRNVRREGGRKNKCGEE